MTAADYVRELRLGAQDDDSEQDDEDGSDKESEADAEAMAEEVQEEMDKAAAAWAKAVTGGSASSVDLSDKKGSDAMLCALVEGLGTTYDRRQHGGALRRAAADAGKTELTEAVFVDWYVRMLYADDDEEDDDEDGDEDDETDDDDDEDEDDNDVAAAPASLGSNPFASSLASATGGWKCAVCMVSNPDTAAKCNCCNADKPGGASTSSGTGTSTSSSNIATGSVPSASITSSGFTFGGGDCNCRQ